MTRIGRVATAVAAVGFSLTTVVGLSSSAVADAQRFELVGPKAAISCSSLQPGSSDQVTSQGVGFVVFNTANGNVTATVSVKRATPNAELPVRLIQGSGDCFTVDGTLTTNGQGNGTLHLKEPITGTRAQVIVDTGSLFTNPTYRATAPYVY